MGWGATIITLVYLGQLALSLPIWSSFVSSASILEYILTKPKFQTLDAEHRNILVPPDEFEKWLTRQTHFSFEAIIGNIGRGPNIHPGVVIASPSTEHPDYFYTWTRDAAITINSLVLQYDDSRATNSTLETIIDSYIDASYHLQRIDNPSGTFESLEGLGEPKFNVDGTAFTGPWGRPQRDGPPLRAIAMINYANSQLRHHKKYPQDFAELYNNIVRFDLDYTAQKWLEPGFDLWEEVNGSHFFTTIVQLRALILGVGFATELGDTERAAEYRHQSYSIRRHLTQFYSRKSSYRLVETLDTSRSGLDSALFLGSIYGLNAMSNATLEDLDNILFPPYSGAVLSSLDSMINDMAPRYQINFGRLQYGGNPRKIGVAIGRYPEDVYNGDGTSLGNPWFLCTATIAQTLYILAQYLITRGDNFVLLADDEHRLIRRFTSREVLSRDEPEYAKLVRDIISYGDSFLDVIREHQAHDGTMSEQFSRYDGYMTGARELTWSYGAFWSATRQRDLAMKLL
ncbi:hypothetical protein TRVA0_070S00254 [Trichomonascus vanleenenianus]|uniref:glucan 1,4-alpha-glucosidase n=1 Tax=Trichomonascus vanleenenianus TaxID=2268995 RepID=UPI003ECA43E2